MYFVVTCPTLILTNGEIEYTRSPVNGQYLILTNGEIEYTRSPVNGQYLEGTTAKFTCISGYSLFGDISTSCQTSRSWSEHTTTCKGKYICSNAVRDFNR